MTMLELLLAVAITGLVAGGIAGMLGAVSAGVGTRRDNREIMVLAHAAQCRLSAYLATSRCVLHIDGGDVTLWLDDARESQTVHATEIRWLRYDGTTNELRVEFVDFPATWTPTACELADQEYSKTTDWATVRAAYASRGLLASRALVDQLAGSVAQLDDKTALNARHVAFNLDFEGDVTAVTVQVSGTIQNHAAPAK
jgi:hypothetical protein